MSQRREKTEAPRASPGIRAGTPTLAAQRAAEDSVLALAQMVSLEADVEGRRALERKRHMECVL